MGDSDDISETKQVAAVNRPKTGPDQLEDMLRLVPEAPTVEKLLQRLVAETQSRPPLVVSPPDSKGLENLLRSYLSGQQQVRLPTRHRPIRRDWNEVVCFPCGKLGHAATWCPALDESVCYQDGGLRKLRGGFVMILPRVATERRRTDSGN